MRQTKKNSKIYDICVAKGMCDKGKELWKKNDSELVEWAKQECDFIIKNKPFTHEEILKLFRTEYLQARGFFVDYRAEQEIIAGKGLFILMLGCKGSYKLRDMSNSLAIADKSDVVIRVQNRGFYTIHLYEGCYVNINIEEGASVLVFKHGKCKVDFGKETSLARIRIKEL